MRLILSNIERSAHIHLTILTTQHSSISQPFDIAQTHWNLLEKDHFVRCSNECMFKSFVDSFLMKLKSKEEAEKVRLQEEEQWEARRKAQELWAKKRRKNLKLN